MRATRELMPLAILVLLSLSALPAHAGLGDMLKKKAAEVVKKDKAKPAATTETGKIESRIQPPVTAETIARFKAGMEYEIAERAKAAKFLSTVKSKDAYEKCKLDWAMSADGQKVSQQYLEAIGKAKTSEDTQKIAEEMGPLMEKAIEDKCGPDPGKYNDNWRAEQARLALGRASDNFAKGDDYAYHTWKEWVTEFCNYIEKLKKEPDFEKKKAQMLDEGLRIHTYGGNHYVYTATEAKHLLENCDTLMPLIKETI
jgi:hypothetical protein